ncbi:hypothetical protein HWV07_07180 [Natronomonas salina]|uniref:DUF7576 family protein n=1 Tax=Natronomonas salina TaxID=1710540 RepID=UPI0015B607E4|nr:hypothetical protein [Natronomonas salina]QLD87491.1 hypothetical protein HWV07_07180 [Natronomonas salina]
MSDDPDEGERPSASESDAADSGATDGADASETYCEQCGDPIETNEWYPVTSDRDEDGSLQLYPFCTEDCQSTWLDERSG